jgi:NADH dehydrogenase
MILVAGATGTLGTKLVGPLGAGEEEVRVLARNPASASSVWGDRAQVVSGDVRDPHVVERAVAGVRTVISAVTGFGPKRDVSPKTVDWQGNAILIQGAKAAGVEHFVLLSVCQAAPDHPIELFRMKHCAEVELMASGLAWTIIRPTAYMETWIELVGAPLLESGKTRIFGHGENPINFVSASDVARYVELAVADPAMQGEAVDVGGPENKTMRDFVATFQELTGFRGRVSHVPLPMMRVMSVLMKPLNPAIAGLIQTAVVMDTRDMGFDSREARTSDPSISPRSLEDVILSDYREVRRAHSSP